MTTKDEALKLPPLPREFDYHKQPMTGWHGRVYTGDQMREYAITAIFEALASEANEQSAQQQEPRAWCQLTAAGGIAYFDGKPMILVGKVGNEMHPTPLYTALLTREWVGLTDEEIGYIADEYATLQGALRAIEAKLKEKNS